MDSTVCLLIPLHPVAWERFSDNSSTLLSKDMNNIEVFILFHSNHLVKKQDECILDPIYLRGTTYMNDSKTKFLIAIIFIAIAIVSLLVAVRTDNNELRLSDGASSAEFSGGLSNLNPLEQMLILAFRELNIPDSAITSTFEVHSETKELTVSVPKGKPMEEIIQVIQNTYQSSSYTLEDSHYSSNRDEGTLYFISSRRNRENIIVRLRRSRTNSFQHNSSLMFIISGIDTVSNETRLKYLMFDEALSYEVSAWSDNICAIDTLLMRYEIPVVIRVPLQSNAQTMSSPYTIHIDDRQRTIDAKITDIMRLAPSAVAISSYGGNLLLENSSSDLFFKELHDRRLTFFDRRTSTSNRARQSANNEDVLYINSNTQLNSGSVDAMVVELRRLANKARSKKELIVWCNASSELIDALEQGREYFESTGVTLKGVSALSY